MSVRCNDLGRLCTRCGSFNSEDNPSALILTEDAQGSRFFGGMPAIVTASLQALPLAMENHQAGVGPCVSDLRPAPFLLDVASIPPGPQSVLASHMNACRM